MCFAALPHPQSQYPRRVVLRGVTDLQTYATTSIMHLLLFAPNLSLSRLHWSGASLHAHIFAVTSQQPFFGSPVAVDDLPN